jgi:hypothetical protein
MNPLSIRKVLCALTLAAAALASSPAPDPTPATLDAIFPVGHLTLPLEELAAKYPLVPGKDFQASEVGRDANASQHVVWIVDREVPPRHDTTRHARSLRRHLAGLRHDAARLRGAPALAYAVYFPPFDGTDRVTAA